jgi:hypothetical protein
MNLDHGKTNIAGSKTYLKSIRNLFVLVPKLQNMKNWLSPNGSSVLLLAIKPASIATTPSSLVNTL